VLKHRPHVLVTLESDDRWQAQLDTLKADYPWQSDQEVLGEDS
jgi:hypothetical protein